jgi:DnaJ-class molecular chaperone
MPVLGNAKKRGDLYATLEIQVPKNLTDEQRKKFKAAQDSLK